MKKKTKKPMIAVACTTVGEGEWQPNDEGNWAVAKWTPAKRKTRTVEVTLRFDSTASIPTLKCRRTWGFQLRLAREFLNNGTGLAQFAELSRDSQIATVKVLRVSVVPKKRREKK